MSKDNIDEVRQHLSALPKTALHIATLTGINEAGVNDILLKLWRAGDAYKQSGGKVYSWSPKVPDVKSGDKVEWTKRETAEG